MSLADMKVFNDFAYAAATEVIDQAVEKFNAASAGTITLTSARNVGDMSQRASYANITGLARYRNAYGSGNVGAVDLTQLQNNSVKVAAGSLPVAFERQQLTHLQRSPEEAAMMIGTQWGKAQMQQMLNAAIAAAAAGMTGNGNVIYDARPNPTTFRGMNKAAAKFGDRAQDIRAWIIHGVAVHDLWDNALTNAEELFRFGDVAVMSDAFGRRFIITDSPSLLFTGSPYGYRTLGLVPGAVLVEDNGDLWFNLDTRNGTENIGTTWQAEYTFQLGVKGFSWNANWNGGTPATPGFSAIASSGNWPQTATFDKDTAGVMLQSGVVAD